MLSKITDDRSIASHLIV